LDFLVSIYFIPQKKEISMLSLSLYKDNEFVISLDLEELKLLIQGSNDPQKILKELSNKKLVIKRNRNGGLNKIVFEGPRLFKIYRQHSYNCPSTT
jgi:hypothetical protein